MNPTETVKNEPVLGVNLLLSVVRLGLAMLITLDIVNLTNEQLESVVAFTAAFFLLVDAGMNAWVRGQVTPIRRFRKSVQTAISRGEQEAVRAPIVPKPVPPVAHPVEP